MAAVTDAGGALKEAFYYEPFGQRTDAQGKPLASAPSAVGSGFTGHEHDDDLGLINMRGRVFDPVIRRFLSPDPHVTNPLSGQSYNRYSYVLNNPTNLIDPTGFDCIGQECSGYGTEYSSSGFESSHGNDYSGVFTRVEPSAPSGFSGSAAGGNGAGAPVQAAERQRLVSMPTGPSAPAGAISGPTVNAGSGADKWNPHSNEGRIHQALFGGERAWQDPLEPYKPALASFSASLIPGLNSYMVLNDPEASVAGKVFAVGTDVLSVVGVGAVIKFAKGSIRLGTGLVRASKAIEGVDIVAGGTEALATRARQIHSALGEIAQTHRTTAVLDTTAGRIVASGGRDLSLVQQRMLVEGEIAGKLNKAHAEVTALKTARNLGGTPRLMAVSRKICPQCTAAIEASGGTLTSPTTAVWP